MQTLVVFALDLSEVLLPPEYAGIGCRLFDLNEGNIIFEGEVLAERPIHITLRWVPQHDFLSHLAEQNEIDFKLQLVLGGLLVHHSVLGQYVPVLNLCWIAHHVKDGGG